MMSGLVRLPALSVRQPWVELILGGRKTIEMRSWTTDYRGQVWLHAGRRIDEIAMERFGIRKVETGAYIGAVVLAVVVPFDRGRWEAWRPQHLVEEPYHPGMYAWILTEPRRLRYIVPGRGSLGLFSPPDDVQGQLYRALAE